MKTGLAIYHIHIGLWSQMAIIDPNIHQTTV